ncbi:MAG: cytochrome c-type biosis protein CcmH [Acidobacteriaceae bacterium]|nr:cytochrome c-type biosis protein CcmH [Acidobacteriaceae bacterium]
MNIRFSLTSRSRVPHPTQRVGWVRHALYLLLIASFVVFGAQASDTANSPRYDKLSHKIMCPCGCNELLGECNHVGCPDSDKMRAKLAASIDKGDDDTSIFRAFQDEYGPTALAAPMFTGFNRFSWWVPPAVLLIGIAGVFFIVRRWRPQTVAMPTPASDPHMLVLERRIRRETGGDFAPHTRGHKRGKQ